MNCLCALQEEHPTEKRRRIYPVLMTVLLVLLLLFAYVFAFPFLFGPSGQRLASSDWSGYAVASNLSYPQPQVTNINGSWTVPTLNVSVGNSFSAVWVGVGGQYDDTLIQIGTEQDSINGQATYSAWYELLPNDSITIDSLSISPGDRITASISLLDPTASIWSIELHDATNEQSFQKNVFYISSLLSAEWIVERPTVSNRIRTLADFGQVTFTDCMATLGRTVGTISGFPYVQITMYNRQNTQLVNVLHLVSNGTSFTVNYLD